MADKETMYLVVAPFAGLLTRGDVVPESALPGPAKEMAAEGSIRKATADEVKAGHVALVDMTDKEPEPTPEAKEQAAAILALQSAQLAEVTKDAEAANKEGGEK